MDRDKQIEEMARDLCDCMPYVVCDEHLNICEHCKNKEMAEYLYNAGYRKASEVAREIFEEIENFSIYMVADWGNELRAIGYCDFAELKKKYTESEGTE